MPAERSVRAAMWEGRHVFVGIRPEHLSLATADMPNTLPAVITPWKSWAQKSTFTPPPWHGSHL
ncbi:hypothetical protein JCM19237_1070 [Photobacterium aphoticum]|uniref:Uncharacterized protein n=1 Tax=Photobacterium aphoticum TaxID=754436 RepID=A0A090QQ67_9GAMM|nr:hypothetical protein JCM19237_1070 [Photobacterium aphoticum]